MALADHTKFQNALHARGLVSALIGTSQVKLPGMPDGTTHRVSIPMNLVVPIWTDRDLRTVLRILDKDDHRLDPDLRYDSFIYLGCGSATIGLEETEETQPDEIDDLDNGVSGPWDENDPLDLPRYSEPDGEWPSDSLVLETLATLGNAAIDRWEEGDLAQAVNDLQEALIGAGLRK